MQTKDSVVRLIRRNSEQPKSWYRLLAPFGYFGAKQKLALRLVAKLPPHVAWVEAFCGSAALTLAKKPAQIEVINDVNGDVVNFFRQVRVNPAALQRQIRLTPYAREELANARQPAKSLSDLERARRFAVTAMMAINGSAGEANGGFSFSNSYVRRGMEARVSRWNALGNYLEVVAERLSRVRIERKDAIDLFANFALRPATLVYLDPPYLARRQKGYDHDECPETYHEKLLRALVRAKCMVMISGYDHDLYKDYLTRANGWNAKRMTVATRGHNGRDSERTEVIWSNKHYAHSLKSGQVRLRLTTQERRDKKLNPERR